MDLKQPESELPPLSTEWTESLKNRLNKLFPKLSDVNRQVLIEKINQVVDNFRQNAVPNTGNVDSKWSEKDVVLITYADQVSDSNGPTLAALRKFLEGHEVTESINITHLLPFYPYSSDDGFSVIDYYDIAPGVGSWDDVRQLNQSVDLMFDLVLNHCSKHSTWFKKFLLGDPDYANYFHVVDGEVDLTQVTRPRSLPLLTTFSTTEGEKRVWTTFSDDQVDLNFSEPAVLVEFLQILLFYVEQGARIIRLDAVAFLWKTIGTSCIHLPETHEVIKLLRDLLDEVAPEVILLTETNVPHKENVSYFGDGDEAHMVYQFSLPPLILDTFIHEDASQLRDWLLKLETIPQGTTFFNFGASHDGVGVRPLEGLNMDPDRFRSLVDEVRNRGGMISTRRQPDGTDTPYELNVSYFDAIVGTGLPAETQVRKFLSAQSIILALPGIPGIYFHSLVGTPNDTAAAESSGIPRRINRRKYQFEELNEILADPDSIQRNLFVDYLKLIKIRTGCAAFHPDGKCEVWSDERVSQVANSKVIIFERQSPDLDETLLIIVNPTADNLVLSLDDSSSFIDLWNDNIVAGDSIEVEAFGFRWLKKTRP